LNTRSRRSMEYADAIVTSGVTSTTTAYYVQAKNALAIRFSSYAPELLISCGIFGGCR